MNRVVGMCVSILGLVAACGPAQAPAPVSARSEGGVTSSAPATAVAPTSAPPAAGPLVLTGTPAIPDALRERLNQYLNTRRASLADVSPDASRMLISTRFGETSQLHVVDGPMMARRQLTFLPEPVGGARWVPDGSGDIVYSADTGGNEQHQLYRMSGATGARVQLTEAGSRNQNAVWTRDGKRVAYMSNQRNKKDFDVVVSDGRNPKTARVLVEGRGYFYPIEFSPDGTQLLVGEYISVNVSRLYVADAATGRTEQLSPVAPEASYKAAKFGPGGIIYVSTDREGEFAQVYAVDPAKNSWTSLTKDIPWDVQGIAVAKDLKTAAFVANENGSSTVYLYDTRRGKLTKLTQLPTGLIGGLKFVDRAPLLAFSVNAPTSPGDAYTYDLRRKKLTRWTASEVGGLDESGFATPASIEFESFDGKKIPAFYYRPEGPGPFPVILNIHGGPEAQARPYFSSFTQMLVREFGIAVVYPNVRGSNGYGKTYLRLDNGFKREDSVKDIGALLDWVAKRPELDGNRVGVMGGSYGGYMVLASLVTYGDRIAAGVDSVGISNFVTFLENTADYRRNLRRVEYGDERDPKMRAFLERISPTNNADKIRSALFVAQGANDPRVPASEAEQIVKVVRESGHDVWYMLAKNEGHGFRKKSNRDTFLLLTALFFQRHLAGTGEEGAATDCVQQCVRSRQAQALSVEAIEASCKAECAR